MPLTPGNTLEGQGNYISVSDKALFPISRFCGKCFDEETNRGVGQGKNCPTPQVFICIGQSLIDFIYLQTYTFKSVEYPYIIPRKTLNLFTVLDNVFLFQARKNVVRVSTR